MIDIRESFGAKLLSALLGTVGLLLIITFLVVRAVTNSQVEAVTARAIQNAGTLFEERNELQRQMVAQLANTFTAGRRALALLDVAIASGDVEYLADQADYEMQLRELTDVLLVFTDADAHPVLTMIRGERITEGDVANAVPLARTLLAGSEMERRGYRVVDGRLYNISSFYIELGSRPIGTITFGLPIVAADVQGVGSVGGFEACFHVGDSCIVQTDRVDTELGSAMLASLALEDPLRIEAGGSEWSIAYEALIPDEPQQGQRIIAVLLDPVLEPFDRIRQALLLGGSGALVLSVLLGIALSRSLTHPVRALVAATERVAHGDYHTTVSVRSRDEMRRLADAFNEMTRGLLMREQYRSVLSKVVSQDIAEELMKGAVELGGENRDVSVLFADIRGFTPMTVGMEPQRVIGLLNDCMERLSTAVDTEGGVVDKFIGDELMAVFGAPVAQPDHAHRAVLAAVRMRDAIEALNRERSRRGEPPVRVGIGINSGVAVAGNMGSTDRLNYTVLGETVNLAARLTSEAKPGEILISRATQDAVGSCVVAPALGSRRLKGFASEIDVFGVVSCQ